MTKSIVALLLSFLVIRFAAAEVVLSAAEQAFIRDAEPVTMCVDPDWAPFERLNEQDKYEGIAAELLQRVAERVGLRLQPVQARTWDESLQASKEGRCRIMSFLNQTPDREKWLIFTEPLFSDPNVIVTREEHEFIVDLRGVRGASVALPKGTMVEEYIRRDFPNLRVIPTNSEAESVDMVSRRRADMTIRTLIGAAYTIRTEGLFNLKIAGQLPDYTNKYRIGVAQNDVMLRDILNKGVATLTAQEREAIWSRYVSVKVEHGIDYRLLSQIVLGAALLLGVSLYWNRKLRRLNLQLERMSVTDRLTGLYNRLYIDETLAREIRRAERYRAPFSIILLDIDYFKQVNDTHGHPVGDQVLITLAALLGKTTRETDVVGRWGGEEFLIVCPQTEHDGAMILAENLRAEVERNVFPVIGKLSISLGVGDYQEGDNANDLIVRADTALYRAKANGRNRVES
jgi:diguanylate cyclase (GGDEF)-like protein